MKNINTWWTLWSATTPGLGNAKPNIPILKIHVLLYFQYQKTPIYLIGLSILRNSFFFFSLSLSLSIFLSLSLSLSFSESLSRSLSLSLFTKDISTWALVNILVRWGGQVTSCAFVHSISEHPQFFFFSVFHISFLIFYPCFSPCLLKYFLLLHFCRGLFLIFFCDQKFWVLSMKMLFINYCWAHSVRDTFRRRRSDRVSFETVTSVDSHWCEYLTHTRTRIHV